MTPDKDWARLAQLESDMRLMDSRLQITEKGVANFRDFQSLMRDFVTDHAAEKRVEMETNERRAKIHFRLLGGLIALVVGCALALFSWVLNGHHVVSINHESPTVAQFDAAIPSTR